MKQLLISILVLLMAVSSAAVADTREDVLSGIARCGAIADDHAWLNCLYGAAQPMRGKLGLPPAPASQTALVPTASPPAGSVTALQPAPLPQKPEKRSGIFNYMFGGQQLVDQMSLKAYRFDVRGLFTITLSNGQVWQQTDDSKLAHWRAPASRYIVSIRQGAAGTDNLTVMGDAEYKVRRVQ